MTFGYDIHTDKHIGVCLKPHSISNDDIHRLIKKSGLKYFFLLIIKYV